VDLSGFLDMKASSLVFTPGVFYQITLDKSAPSSTAGVYVGGVDQHADELWGSFGLKYSF
jgi:hypothetical protein